MQAHGRAQSGDPLKYWAALFWVPALAQAAEAITSRALTFDGRFLVAHLFVMFLSVCGWAGSSLPKVAGWVDGVKEKLEILQGIIIAQIAGGIAYYGGFYLMPGYGYQLAEVACFMATIVASWGGDRFMTPLLNTFARFAERVTGGNRV